MLQCIHDSLFFFFWTLWHIAVFFLGFIVIFSNLKPALTLDLSDIERRNLKATFVKYILFDIFIFAFAFRLGNIFLVKLQFHFDMIVDIFPAQKYLRLHMKRVNTEYVKQLCLYVETYPLNYLTIA